MKRGLGVVVAFLLAAAVVSCGPKAPELTGMWVAGDGTTKIFHSDGRCQNLMDVDIGGGMSCVLSSEENDDGLYALMVTQGPNTRTLYLQEADSNSFDVYDGEGNLQWNMTRQ